MMFKQTFFTDLFKYIAQFRLQWGASYLQPMDAGQCIQMASHEYADIGVQSFFVLKSRLQAGWYMLEVKIKLPTVRINGRVFLDGRHKGGGIQPLGLPLYSGRMCKRLIHLTSGGQLLFNPRLAQGDFELQHFRLVRVSQKFAISRMLIRLKALHPRYRMSQIGEAHSGRVDSLKASDLQTLWTDYCALFEEGSEIVPYPDWIREFDTLADECRIVMRMRAEQFEPKPLVSVLMTVFNPNPAWLAESIEAVLNQIYPSWELCIAVDASTDPTVRPVLERYAQLNKRIKVVFHEQNEDISAASNSGLVLAQGDWIALLGQHDVLAEHALFWVVDAINEHPGSRLIYSDEDKIDENDARFDPYFKCEWNPDLFYSQNMISHLGVYYAALVREVGGFRTGLEDSQDYDLALRCIEHIAPEQIHHIPRVLYHLRAYADSTEHDLTNKSYASLAGVKAINEHLGRQGVNANAEWIGFGYRVRYSLPDNLPLVSLIIPTRNEMELLKRCVESILANTTYANYEILIVDNGSDDPATLRYMSGLASETRLRVLRDERPFNYSALNNAAVKLARGEIVGLINNDVEVISPDWLSEMVSHALRPEVGAVGARLWYGNNTIQHAGVVLGVHGIAGHVHRFLPKDSIGYCGRAALIQSFFAVTGACLLVRKSIYEALGGLNETELQVAHNDVDFCLRLREAGYRNIWTPYAELYHHESATRGFDDTPEKLARSAKEIAYMQRRWGKLLQDDPAYSPNLNLDAEDFSLAWPPRVRVLLRA